MPSLPSVPPPFLAALGLAAETIDRARKEVERLPDSAIEIPMTLVSLALQASMRVNQEYARLVGRGEEVLTRLQVTDEPPPWATFDDEVDGPPATATTVASAVTDTNVNATSATDSADNIAQFGTPRGPGTSRFDAVSDEAVADE